MKRSYFLGSRLYTQIVYPLLAAAIFVGVVATLIAVYFLSDLTNKWVDQVAENSVENLAIRCEDQADQMQRLLAFVASTESVKKAAASRDETALARQITRENAALEYEAILVVDDDGRVVASSDGDVAAWSRKAPQLLAASPKKGISMAAWSSSTYFSASQPIAAPGSRYRLVALEAMDGHHLEMLGVSDDSALCFYSRDGVHVASAFGDAVEPGVRAELIHAADKPSAGMIRSLESREARSVASSVRAGSSSYQLRAEPVHLADGRSVGGYLVGIVSREVSQEAGRTTTNLIMMWSIVAVVALVGLGGWVARRVSDPLVELSAGARRIADGDFETKVQVEGANEIAQLAGTFNQMTDSLRERSESLTKKVLELATLYEMSRALGATLDLTELLGSVLDSALRIFDLDLGYMALRDKETGDVTIRSVRGAAESLADGALRSSMSEWVVREGRPLIFNPDSGARSSQVDVVTGAKAALCVPLISTEGTIGSLTIGSSNGLYRFNSDDVRLLSTIANHATIAIGNIELFTSLQEAYLATVRSLAAAVDAKDSFTRGHSDRVATFATLIAERMGLSHEQRIALEMAAYLHDIGKIGVREDILLKPGRLDDLEMAQMRHHPLIAANILKPVAFPWAITPVVRHHHEAYDGSGYPAGLKGDEIPLLARILTVADSFEAMTADRPYRAGRSAEEAVEELNRCSGSQFDPRVVEVFVELIGELADDDRSLLSDEEEEIMPEEARAIFAALIDGLFGSFRRLGGPRLAANIEQEVDLAFVEESLPFRLSRGQITFLDDVPVMLNGEVEQMQLALRHVDRSMARVSGSTLVEHFYHDAVLAFSGRMRQLARMLGFDLGDA